MSESKEKQDISHGDAPQTAPYGYAAGANPNYQQQYHTGNPLPSPISGQNVTVIMGQPTPHKSLCEAYILCIPLGVLGLHHFYLRRYAFGFLYFFTLGLCGVGWLVDIIRMPWLVRDANDKIDNPGKFEPLTVTDTYVMWFPLGILGFHHYYLRRPHWGIAYTFTLGLFGIGWLIDVGRIPSLVREANARLENELLNPVPRNVKLCDAYILGVTPAGLFGAHHFYMGNFAFGMFYLITLGGAGIGWIVDWFRMKWLVDRANNPDHYLLGKRHKHVDDAYVMAFPFGILGAHQFYLERPGWGVLYFFTGGLAGIGWLADLVRMPCLVKQRNKELENELNIIAEVQQQIGAAVQCTVSQRDFTVYPSANVNNGSVINETPILQPPPYSVVGTGYSSMSHTYVPPPQAANQSDLPPGYYNNGYDQGEKK